MKRAILYGLAAILSILSCGLSFAQVESAPLGLGYTYDFSNPDYISRDNISNLEMVPISLFNSALDNPIRGRPEAKLGATLLAIVIDRGVLRTGHEYGHLSAFSRLGYDDFRFGNSLDEINHRAAPLSIFREAMSSETVAVSVGNEEQANLWRRFGLTDDYYEFTAALEGGGLNQNQATLVRYRDRLFDNRFVLLDSVAYAGLAFSTFLYSGGGDISDYVAALDHNGVHTSVGAVKLISFTRLLSGSALVAGPGYLRNIIKDDYSVFQLPAVKEWSSRNITVYWPELESYLSRRGPTVKLNLPLKHRDGWWFFPSVEQSIAGGGAATEIGGYLNVPIHQDSPLSAKLSGFANTEGGVWLEPGIGIRAADWLALDLTGYYGNSYTFHRDIYGATYDFVDKTELGFRAGFTVFLQF